VVDLVFLFHHPGVEKGDCPTTVGDLRWGLTSIFEVLSSSTCLCCDVSECVCNRGLCMEQIVSLWPVYVLWMGDVLVVYGWKCLPPSSPHIRREVSPFSKKSTPSGCECHCPSRRSTVYVFLYNRLKQGLVHRLSSFWEMVAAAACKHVDFSWLIVALRTLNSSCWQVYTVCDIDRTKCYIVENVYVDGVSESTPCVTVAEQNAMQYNYVASMPFACIKWMLCLLHPPDCPLLHPFVGAAF
jgi:hypothetical protein